MNVLDALLAAVAADPAEETLWLVVAGLHYRGRRINAGPGGGGPWNR